MIADVVCQIKPNASGVCLIADTPGMLRSSVVLIPWNGSLCRLLYLGRSEAEDFEIVRFLQKQKPAVLYGRPSVITKLSEVAAEHHVDIDPDLVFLSGENLFEDQRRRIEASFSRRIFNAYMATEGGMIGITCPYQNGFHVQEDRVHLEVINERGEISDEGTGHILLTNHSNRCCSFIRYLIGDVGTLKTIDCACGFQGKTIIDLPGKEAQSLHFGDRTVATSLIEEVLKRFHIKQFLVTQTALESVTVEWIPTRYDLDLAVESLRIENQINAIVGSQRCEVKVVDNITRPAGKHRRFQGLQIPTRG
ncbi:hypothetical protein [Roseibium album]|uniref:hypothetical protein n=1 Tax=Roseibium album TaxID=311410 RepID=UPI00248F5A57|nr:hypothetical protein [Roseibium album]